MYLLPNLSCIELLKLIMSLLIRSLQLVSELDLRFVVGLFNSVFSGTECVVLNNDADDDLERIL